LKTRFLSLLLALVLVFSFTATVWAETFSVTDRYKIAKVISFNQGDAVFVVSTWCPYCRVLLKTLNDKRVKPHLNNQKVVFLLIPEWTKVQANPQRYGKSAEEVQELKTHMPEYTLKPSALAGVKQPIYFFDLVNASNFDKNRFIINKISGLPAVYDFTKKAFVGNTSAWIEANTTIPKDVYAKVYAEYLAKQ
jgi:thiol-disulfide isomerase/thioredoxin